MMENDAYLELRRRLCGLSVAVTELYRIIPYSTIGSKFYYRETDVERVIREALIRR